MPRTFNNNQFCVLLYVVILFVIGCISCGTSIGPCTTHPHLLQISRDSGVSSLTPPTTERRHSTPRVHGLHYGFSRVLYLTAYCPYA